MKYLLPLIALLIWSCSTSKKITNQEVVLEQEITFDTFEVSPPVKPDMVEKLNPYNGSAKRDFDLLHTKLELSFDWDKEQVKGKAYLDIAPIFREVSKVVLDAKGMLIHNVQLIPSNQNMVYSYDNAKLDITLPSSLQRGEKLTILIDYTARPNASEGYEGGAISSDKGLFFIDPKGLDPLKPTQIWTQGETENNSRWFPTFDKPNERCSQEIYVTVADKYTTLSNGLLVSSKKNADGTRTDYWKQDKPHAPYLFMLAVGEFAWVNEKWNNIPLHYIVEPEYEADAKAIFDHTPEMLTFFSDILDYPYPWDKYAQVITRDYVSGAMENTSAVIFGEFVQKHKRELIDNDNDYIVAHEMFHHWFGDLVTCESWANLTLNEGFANYSEYLWSEHHKGRTTADQHRYNELRGYLSSGGFHPLIHYRYGDKEEMFDAHSYNKGGLVLHMLRYYVGEEAFFGALNKYLVDNQYTAVEVDELRMAFEDITGEDLHWFFDQWYLREGHPIINASWTSLGDNKMQLVTTQLGESYFRLPVEVTFHDMNGANQSRQIWIEKGLDTFTFNTTFTPATYIFDSQNTLLAVISEEGKSAEHWYHQFRSSKLYYDKRQALDNMDYDSDYGQKIMELALNDSFYEFRVEAINYFMNSEVVDPLVQSKIIAFIDQDAHSEVRTAAVDYLAMNQPEIFATKSAQIMANEEAYNVLSTTFLQAVALELPEVSQWASQLQSENTNALNEGLAMYFTEQDSEEARNWYQEKIKRNSIFESLPLYLGYGKNLYNYKPEGINLVIQDLKSMATKSSSGLYERYYSTYILSLLGQMAQQDELMEYYNKIRSEIDIIKSLERNAMLKEWYQGM